MFGLLFLLPAMLTVRREIALIAALLISSYAGWWQAIGLIAATLLAAERLEWLLEPVPTPANA